MAKDSVANAMKEFLDRWRDVVVLEVAHQTRKIGDKPVVWWFNKANASTEELMAALAADPLLIVPGKPHDSRFLTTFLKPTRPMGQRLAADRHIVEEWVSSGATIPVSSQVALTEFRMSVGATVPFSEATTESELLANEPTYFHQLINIEDYSDFIPDAKRLAEHYLREGAQQHFTDEYAPLEDFVEYDEDEFESRIKQIYDNLLVSMYNPHWFNTGLLGLTDNYDNNRTYALGRLSDEAIRVSRFQLAPFNLTDGAWLRDIVEVGPTDKVRANLASIWNDEAGNGITSQNHPNVYDALLKNLNIFLPAITTRKFILENFLPGAFTSSVFELAISKFPQAFLPELLGMTLFLEWEATPTLTSIVRLLESRGINPLFYRLHVAIDNISEGHGALAKEAVKLYLEDARENGGDATVHELWKRIRNGYLTWLTIGGTGISLIELILIKERKQVNRGLPGGAVECWPDPKDYYRRQMLRLIERKAPFAREVHGGRSIGGRPLSELFDDPNALLDALVQNGYIDQVKPRDSKLLSLMDFNGPMFKVFTEAEEDVILDWIESLGATPGPCIDPIPDVPATDLPEAALKIIRDKAADASAAHAGIKVKDASGNEVALASVFAAPENVVGILISNGWIVPGDPDRSMFYTRLISDGGPMDWVFDSSEKEVLRRWIAAGAKLPSQGDTDAESFLAEHAGIRGELIGAQPRSLRHMIGMGAVH